MLIFNALVASGQGEASEAMPQNKEVGEMRSLGGDMPEHHVTRA